MQTEKPDYGNWIRLRPVLAILITGLTLAGLALLSIPLIPRIILALLAIPLLGTGFYLIYVYVQFASWGGGLQERLWNLLLDQLTTDGQGQALDIGTGNAALAVRLAKRYPTLHITGIDSWGSDWVYAQSTCERNAHLEGVGERATFQKASAAALPFDNASFDHVVSHFVFHEVSEVPDKREVIREALRVLREGGTFAFQDMFLDRAMYGTPDSLVATVHSWGVSEVTLIETRSKVAVPWLLRNRRTLGYASILQGRK